MINNKIEYPNARKLNSFREFVDDTAKRFPTKNAFVIKEKIEANPKYQYITYTDLKNEVDAFGQGLINLGLRGKRVAIIGKNSYEWILTHLAVMSSVGVSVPLDKGLQAQEIESLLVRSKADCVVFDPAYIDIITDIKNRNTSSLTNFICMKSNEAGYTTIKEVIEIGKKELDKGKTDVFNYDVDPKSLAVIYFTSGTTALAKGVMLSQDNILSNIYSMDCMIEFLDTDMSIAFLPFHHTFGSNGQLMMLHNGVCTSFCDGLKYIQKNLQEYKVSVFVCVPQILEAMYKKIQVEIKKQGKEKTVAFGRKLSGALLKVGIDIRRKLFKEVIDKLGGAMRFAICGAAGLDPDVAKGLYDFGIIPVQGYGLTETSPVLAAENAHHIAPGTVGVPLHDVEIVIDNPDEKGVGEIKAKGPNIMLGYYENEEATNEVLKDGWFYTGDLGYFNKNNDLVISGRKKTMIVLKNGKKIFPEELEVLINALPYVAESMVFGYPKDDDVVVSVEIQYNTDYVKTHMNDISEKELYDIAWADIKKINQTLPTYKYIKKLFLTTEEMIKTTTAKVKRFKEIEKLLEREKNQNNK